MLGTTHIYASYGLPEVTVTKNWLSNIIIAAIFTSLGTTVLLLRLSNTVLRGRPTGKDDMAMYVAFTANTGYTIASVIALRWGVGLRKEEVPTAWTIQALKATYAVEVFYYLAILLVKLSMMCMYLRLSVGLGRAHLFYKGTRWTMGLLVLHFISTMIVAGMQCIPMSKFWDPDSHTGEGFCIDITAFFYSTNVFTIVTDLPILALPIPTFWRLQMPGKQKLGVIAIFAVGLVSTVASCVRLYSVRMFVGTEKGLENAAPINMWSFIEINLGIFCASVPAIKTLFVRPRTRTPSGNTPSSGKRSGMATSGPLGSAGPTSPPITPNAFSRHETGEVELGDFPRWQARQIRQAQLGLPV